jgi:hypothetical protein
MASEIGTFVGAIAGRKAQAEIEGMFYLAEGAFDVARGICPPDPGLIARGLGEIGAGMNMLKVAGKSGSAGVGGGGGGGSSSRYGADDHGGSSTPGGGAAGPGSGGAKPTIIWHQYGPTGNMADFARTLAGVQNALVGSGQIKVVATNALTNGAKLT